VVRRLPTTAIIDKSRRQRKREEAGTRMGSDFGSMRLVNCGTSQHEQNLRNPEDSTGKKGTGWAAGADFGRLGATFRAKVIGRPMRPPKGRRKAKAKQ